MGEFQCPQCDKKYSYRKGLQRHIASVHERKEVYTCEECHKSFRRLDNLNRHRLIHQSQRDKIGEKSSVHQCEECNKTFLRHDKLKRHQQTHQFKLDDVEESEIVLKNTCDECGKAFSRRGNLLRHLKTHDNKDVQSASKNTPSTSRVINSISDASIESLASNKAERAVELVTSSKQNDADFLPSVEENLRECLKKHWSSIETRFKCQRVLDIFNFRLFQSHDDIKIALIDIWRKHITCRVKINCSPAFVLQHKTSGELRYFHSSSNNACLFDKPALIKTEADLSTFLDDLLQIDVLERVRMQRPNTAWGIACVTNVTFYLSKILRTGKIGGPVDLPSYIVKHKAILSLHKDRFHRARYEDNLCFFRCLAIKLLCRCRAKCFCSRVNEREVMKLFKRYRRAREGCWTFRQFKGIGIKDLLFLENLFKISITVFQLEPNGASNVIWSSKSAYPTKLHLNLHDKHFSLIKRLDIYALAYDCERCSLSFSRLSNLKRHSCSGQEQRLKFVRDTFSPPPTIFDELERNAGIVVDPEHRFYPFRITYDIECFMAKNHLPDGTNKIEYRARHELLSISACSNVPGYTSPRCFVSDGSAEDCISNFIEYICRISDDVKDILCEKYADVLDNLRLMRDEQEKTEEPFKEYSISHPRTYAIRSLNGLLTKFIRYLSSVPVVGFNSQRYDLNVMKGPLLRFLHQRDKIRFTIKRDSKMQCIETDKFRFLDISNYIAPGFSYEKYLRAFDCAQQKGFFPYEWFDSLNKLEETALPPHAAFYSSLSQANITEDEYQLCQRVWNERRMRTMRDFLIWYNNLDVVPFLEALEKQSQVYRTKGIDMLKSAISLPGLAVRWLFTEVDNKECDVALIDEQNKDLHHLIKDNLVGGPSIVFHRYHEKDATKIREMKYGSEARTCREVLGVDANALYLWSMMQDMPTGFVIRRKAEENFIPKLSKKFGKKALGWLEWIAHAQNIYIEHEFNKGEKRIGQHGIPVDGYCEETNTVYQFHGCLFHGHQCRLTNVLDSNPVNGKAMAELRADTELKESYVKALGYRLERIYECQWEDIINSCHELEEYLEGFYNDFLGEQRAVSQRGMIRAIESGELFGLVLCDIHVPDHLREKFSEMPPIFKNTEISRDQLSQHMAEFAESTSHLKRPQRMLIGSMKGENVLLLSELLRWYLAEGLEVTRVFEVFQFKPKKCFERFGLSVSSARRLGDSDPSKSLLADTAKLIGNSVYGKTITNKEKHRDIEYADDDKKASNKIISPRFLSMDEIADNFYEMMMEKKMISMNVPVVLGFTILQYAKLRMLEFYYNFMDRYFDRRDFQYVEMDTDSAYMALSGPLESLVMPQLRKEFYDEYHNWFPSPYCANHRAEFLRTKLNCSPWEPLSCCLKRMKHDNRTPGLFKEEFRGNGIIALNSKTYYCWSDDKLKLSSKGLSKRHNNLTKQQYMDVLRKRKSISGKNRGFVYKNHEMVTYEQMRTGLTYFYAKRKVCDDGISTEPID